MARGDRPNSRLLTATGAVAAAETADAGSKHERVGRLGHHVHIPESVRVLTGSAK